MTDKADYGPRGFSAYMRTQWAEIASDFNRWVTGVQLNRNPTDEDLHNNYVASGGAERFRKKWFAVVAEIRSSWNRWFTGEKVGHDPKDHELYEHFVASGAESRFNTQWEKMHQ